MTEFISHFIPPGELKQVQAHMNIAFPPSLPDVYGPQHTAFQYVKVFSDMGILRAQ
jgi:hypothetical protein